jgi:hypothetical protein
MISETLEESCSQFDDYFKAGFDLFPGKIKSIELINNSLRNLRCQAITEKNMAVMILCRR